MNFFHRANFRRSLVLRSVAAEVRTTPDICKRAKLSNVSENLITDMASDPGGHDTSQEDVLVTPPENEDELYERQATRRMPRRDDDDVYLGPTKAAPPKQKAKGKKPRHTAIPLDLQYGNRPKGASSSSKFAGDDDGGPEGDPFDQPETVPSLGGQHQQQMMPMMSNADEMVPENWEQLEGFVDHIGSSGGDGGQFHEYAPIQYQVLQTPYEEPPNDYSNLPPLVYEPAIVDSYASMPVYETPDEYHPWSTDDGTGAQTDLREQGDIYGGESNQFVDHPTADDDRNEQDDNDGLADDDEELKNVDEEDGGFTPPSSPRDDTGESGEGDDEEDEESEGRTQSEAEELEKFNRHNLMKNYEEQIQRLKDEVMNLKKLSDSSKKAMQSKIDDLTKDRDAFEENFEKVSSALHSEHQKSLHEKNKLKEELGKFKAQVNKLQSDLDEKTAACNRLESHVSNLEIEKSELLRAVVESTRKPCNCKIDSNAMKSRACAAEAALVKMKKQVELRNLERACRDAEFIIAHLTSIIEKARHEDVAPMIEYQAKWKINLETLKNNVKFLEKSFDDQIAQIEKGVPLASLQPIKIPPPPVAPQPPAKPIVNPALARPAPNSSNRTSMTSTPMTNGGPPIRQPTPPLAPRMPSAFTNGQNVSTLPPRESVSPRLMNGFVGRPSAFVGQSSFGMAPSTQVSALARLRADAASTTAARAQDQSQQQVSQFPQGMPHVPPGFPANANVIPPIYRPAMQTEEERRQAERRRVVEMFEGFNVAPPRLDDPVVESSNSSSSGFRPITPVATSTQQHNMPGGTGGVGRVSDAGFAAGQAVASGNTTQAQPAAVAAQGTGEKSKLERLIDEIILRMPHLTRDKALKCVEQFRELQESKTLKGIKFLALVDGICEHSKKVFPPTAGFMDMAGAQHQAYPMPRLATSNAPSALSAMSSATSRMGAFGDTSSQQQNRAPPTHFVEDECFVCLEKLSIKKILRMDCKHVAHEECLHQWFAQQKSCPMCRSLHLRHDEYPALGE